MFRYCRTYATRLLSKIAAATPRDSDATRGYVIFGTLAIREGILRVAKIVCRQRFVDGALAARLPCRRVQLYTMAERAAVVTRETYMLRGDVEGERKMSSSVLRCYWRYERHVAMPRRPRQHSGAQQKSGSAGKRGQRRRRGTAQHGDAMLCCYAAARQRVAALQYSAREDGVAARVARRVMREQQVRGEGALRALLLSAMARGSSMCEG